MNKEHKKVFDGFTGEMAELVKGFTRYEGLRGIKTTRKIPYTLKPFFRFLHRAGMDLKEINYKRAQEYQTYLVTLRNPDGTLHYSSSAVRDMINVAKNLYNYLKVKGIVVNNPFNSIRRVRMRKNLPRCIPVEEVLAGLLERCRCFWKEKLIKYRRNLYKIHVMVELMYASGLRLSEVAGLKRSDILLEEKLVRVREGKGGKERTAYLTEYASRVLKIYINNMRRYVNWKEKSRYLFGVSNGRNLESMLNKWLKRLGAECGIERLTSHIFRHALGFHLLRRGCDMRYIQLILGHECMETTSIYTKVEKSDLRRELDSHYPRQFRRHGEKRESGK